MSTICVMQPYLYPYPLYYRMAVACDIFVVLDDVNYRTNSFINRNRIGTPEKPTWFRRAVVAASSFRLINEHHYLAYNEKIWVTLAQLYSRSDHLQQVTDLLQSNARLSDTTVSNVNSHSIASVLEWIDIKRDFVLSSSLDYDSGARGVERVLAICETLQAQCYVNLPGGRALYSREVFSQRGIDLRFIEGSIEDKASTSCGFDALSIIHSMMWLGKDALRTRLTAPCRMVQ